MIVTLEGQSLISGFPEVTYAHWSEFVGWNRAGQFLLSLIERYGCRTVLEVGSGANPTLSEAQIEASHLRYISSDLDEGELAKASPRIEARCFDVEGDTLPPDLVGKCDLVFSRMVNEHIRDGKKYHANMRRLLVPNGIAVHCSASLFTLPFLANLMVPDAASDRLLKFFAARETFQHGKFRAYYSWCRGPTHRMISQLTRVGYDVISFRGYFGHGYYRKRLPLFDRFEQAKAHMLVAHPVPQLCSYIALVLRRRD